MIQDIEELIYAQDVPLFSTSTYAQFSVMKRVKESGVKVVLDGQEGMNCLVGICLITLINGWMICVQEILIDW